MTSQKHSLRNQTRVYVFSSKCIYVLQSTNNVFVCCAKFILVLFKCLFLCIHVLLHSGHCIVMLIPDISCLTFVQTFLTTYSLPCQKMLITQWMSRINNRVGHMPMRRGGGRREEREGRGERERERERETQRDTHTQVCVCVWQDGGIRATKKGI